MFRRKAINLLKLIAVLTAAAAALLLRNYIERPQALTVEKIGLNPSTVKNAETLEIKQGKNALKIEKKGGEWFVEGRPADTKKVNEFLDSISSMSVEAYLGSVKGKEREYSLDAFSRYEVIFRRGKSQVKLYFGKVGPSIQSRYFRLSGSDRVYIVSGTFSDKLSAEVDDWREKRVFKLEGLKEMEVETTSSVWSLKFSNNTAEIVTASRKVRLKQEEFEVLKIELDSVRAESFVESTESLKADLLRKPEAKLRLRYGEETKNIAIFKKDSEYYLAKDEAFDWFYVVPRYNLDVIFENPLDKFAGE